MKRKIKYGLNQTFNVKNKYGISYRLLQNFNSFATLKKFSSP